MQPYAATLLADVDLMLRLVHEEIPKKKQPRPASLHATVTMLSLPQLVLTLSATIRLRYTCAPTIRPPHDDWLGV